MSSVWKKICNIFVFIIITIVCVVTYNLFFKFIIGIYASDFPSHIETVIKGNPGYSFMHKLIWICYQFAYSEKVFAVLMSLLIIGTCIGMRVYLIQRIGDAFPHWILSLIAIALIFTSNLYIPHVFEHYYSRYTNVSQPWHNSTYILMRFFSIWVILLFFNIYGNVENNKFSIRDGIIFCVLLSLCNYSKPNFFLAFAPATLLIFICLFIRFRGKNFASIFKWGMCYLFSIPCMFYMVSVVYDKSENSQVAFSSENLVDYLFGHSGVIGGHCQFIICEISNLIFPLFVIFTFLILKYRKVAVEFSRLLQGILMFFIAHIEQLIMIDDGPRKASGNYSWGVYCFGMILFMICIGEWLRAYSKKHISKALFLCGGVIFVVQILCGIIYFIELTYGLGYVI